MSRERVLHQLGTPEDPPSCLDVQTRHWANGLLKITVGIGVFTQPSDTLTASGHKKSLFPKSLFSTPIFPSHTYKQSGQSIRQRIILGASPGPGWMLSNHFFLAYEIRCTISLYMRKNGRKCFEPDFQSNNLNTCLLNTSWGPEFTGAREASKIYAGAVTQHRDLAQ